MQAIETKFKVDNNGNSKIIAKCHAGRMIKYVSEINYYISQTLNEYVDNAKQHYIVAKMLADKLGWTEDLYGKMVMGASFQSNGYCFCFIGKNRENIPSEWDNPKRS